MEKPYNFKLSIYQAAVVLLFNENQVLSLQKIEEETNISWKA